MNPDEATERGSAEHGNPRWGLGLSDLAPGLCQRLHADDAIHGAVIQQVVPGSSADNAGLQRGDVIMEVNRHPVQSADDVRKQLAGVEKDGDALVLIWTNG